MNHFHRQQRVQRRDEVALLRTSPVVASVPEPDESSATRETRSAARPGVRPSHSLPSAATADEGRFSRRSCTRRSSVGGDSTSIACVPPGVRRSCRQPASGSTSSLPYCRLSIGLRTFTLRRHFRASFVELSIELRDMSSKPNRRQSTINNGYVPCSDAGRRTSSENRSRCLD
jgi:hypothetical protein